MTALPPAPLARYIEASAQAQQLLDVHVRELRDVGDAGAGRGRDRLAQELHLEPVEPSHEVGGDALGGHRVDLAEDDPELVSAEAADQIALPQARGEDLADRDEKPVPGQVAVPVVDGLEAVEVDGDQRPRAPVATTGGEEGLELLVEAPAVGEARELVPDWRGRAAAARGRGGRGPSG